MPLKIKKITLNTKIVKKWKINFLILIKKYMLRIFDQASIVFNLWEKMKTASKSQPCILFIFYHPIDELYKFFY